jgi:hypothetical protein
VKTYAAHDEYALKDFVRDGYVVYRDIFSVHDVMACKKFVVDNYSRLRDPHEQAVKIMDELSQKPCFKAIAEGAAARNIMRRFIGPDIAIFNYDALWINVPKDKNPVLLKGQHTDAWTGTSVNTIFAKVFLTDVDKHNGIAVSPGSHLQGMLPVRNRAIDPVSRARFKSVNLDSIRAGDWLVWHPLLVHATVGHSAKNTRISITSRYTSTETPFSSQERALGYRTLSVGPMNQILRLVGNDYLTPLRTYGGTVAIDKRLKAIYG